MFRGSNARNSQRNSLHTSNRRAARCIRSVRIEGGGKNEVASTLQAVARARNRVHRARARARRYRLRRAAAGPAAEQRDDGAGEGSLTARKGLQERPAPPRRYG